MWKRIKQTIDELARNKPGERFERYHDRHHQVGREHRFRQTCYTVLGWVLIAAGAILTVLPVVPGFFLIIPGLALIAVQSKWVAQVLDRMECRVRQLKARVQKWRA